MTTRTAAFSMAAAFCAVLLLSGCASSSPRAPSFVISKIAVPENKSAPEGQPENIAQKQPAQKLPETAEKTKAPSPDNTQISRIQPVPEKQPNRFLNENSFVTKWNILGPFAFNGSDAKEINDVIHREFVDGEKDLSGSQNAPKGTKWNLYNTNEYKNIGEVDIGSFYPENKGNAAAYAVSVVQSPDDLSNLILYTGSKDFIKVWINGKLVHTYNKNPREGVWDQDIVKGIKLQKGFNHILVKSAKVSGGNWNFFFRLATGEDVPISVFK